jgi:hypothetical protein
MIRRKFLKSLAVFGSMLFIPQAALATRGASRARTAWSAIKSPAVHIAGLRRIAALRRDVASLPVCEEYRAALFKSIDLYRDQIISRPAYTNGEGWDDLEALQQVTLGDRMEQWLAERIERYKLE